MNYSELAAAARGKMGEWCRACPVCDGRGCRNHIPGPGAKGVGDVAIRNHDAWGDLRVNMDTLHEPFVADTSLELFGRELVLPVLIAPVGDVSRHYGPDYDTLSYNRCVLEAASEFGTIALTGDGPDESIMREACGLIARLGALDVAGGDVVHISSGVSGVVLCLLVGPRRGNGFLAYRPHNIPFILLGAALLWFGWFAFNSGSALCANGMTGYAFMTTLAAGSTGICMWMIIDTVVTGKPTLMGACTGCLAGLVVITPGAGYVPIWAALIEAVIVVPICYFAITKLKRRFGYDDALDAFGCHGIGGIVGGVCTGLFTSPSLAVEDGMYGLVYGSGKLLGAQLAGIGITLAVVVVMTLAIWGVIRLAGGEWRVDKREEANGLDRGEHNENAYPAFTGLD